MEDDMVNAKARAEAFWDEVFNRHDLTRIEEFIAPGSVNHNARAWTADGPQGAREVFGRLWAGSSDMHFQLESMVAEGDKVVCIGIMHGTHDGPFQGIPATRRHTRARAEMRSPMRATLHAARLRRADPGQVICCLTLTTKRCERFCGEYASGLGAGRLLLIAPTRVVDRFGDRVHQGARSEHGRVQPGRSSQRF
jgi:predicted ester cyclase